MYMIKKGKVQSREMVQWMKYSLTVQLQGPTVCSAGHMESQIHL